MITSNNSQYLDGKECLKIWAELGSLGKAQSYFENKGIVNPTTGNPPTRMSISYAAWKWALETRENLVFAQKYYFEPLVLGMGQVWTEDDWGKWITQHAHTSYVRKRYLDFLRRFPEYDKYDIMLYGRK